MAVEQKVRSPSRSDLTQRGASLMQAARTRLDKTRPELKPMTRSRLHSLRTCLICASGNFQNERRDQRTLEPGNSVQWAIGASSSIHQAR